MIFSGLQSLEKLIAKLLFATQLSQKSTAALFLEPILQLKYRTATSIIFNDMQCLAELIAKLLSAIRLSQH
jgi:hypothetical protein